MDYWNQRKNYKYYSEVIKLAKKYAPQANSVIDVGSRDVPIVTELDWIAEKTAIDLEILPQFSGVHGIKMNFMNYISVQIFDLVLCLQVLEHLDEPKKFAQKLIENGKTIIISIPYMWSKKMCKWHKQDPIDEDKLLSWMEISYTEKVIVADEGLQRLIAVYKTEK